MVRHKDGEVVDRKPRVYGQDKLHLLGPSRLAELFSTGQAKDTARFSNRMEIIKMGELRL